jgi:hypothetical protein
MWVSAISTLALARVGMTTKAAGRLPRAQSIKPI